MKTKLIFIYIGLSLAIILGQFGVFNALLFLFLVGAIPGTDISVSPLVMLAVFVCLAGFLVFRFSSRSGLKVPTKQSTARKRYSQI